MEQITIKSYQKDITRTFKDHDFKDNLKNCCVGLAGEVGEVLEPIKKFCWHGKQLDLESLELELGDVLAYTFALINYLNLDAEKVIEKNIKKRNARYARGDFRIHTGRFNRERISEDV